MVTNNSSSSQESILVPTLVSYLAWLLIQCIGITNRAEHIGKSYNEITDNGTKPHIFVFWHSRMIITLYLYHHHKLTTLVSRSKDGEIIAQIMKRFGTEAVRGSSSRYGKESLLQLVRQIHNGISIVITPDGPRGPKEKLQPGAIQLARLSGVPIVPVGVSCSKGKVFNSWDNFILPYPFGKFRVVIGEPVSVAKEDKDDKFEAKRLAVEAELHRVNSIANEINTAL